MSLGNKRTLRWAAPLLIAAGISSVGCKSGMKFPGSSMFGWNREPSAETLSSDMATSKFPESPANKSTPSALASSPTTKPVGTMGQTATSPYGASNPYAAVGSYGAPATAAAANGYQTGPYNTTSAYNPTATVGGGATLAGNLSNRSTVGGTYTGNAGLISPAQPTTSTGPYPSGSLAPSMTASRPATMPTQSAYAPNTQLPPSTGFPASTIPSTTVGTLAGSAHAAAPTMSSPAGMAQPTTMANGYSMPNAVGSQVTSIPNHVQAAGSPSAPLTGQTIPVGYPASGSTPWSGAVSAASQTSGLPSATSMQASTVPNATGYQPTSNLGSNLPAANNTNPNVTTVTAGGFRPGTTGRSTSYNFGTTGTPVNSTTASPMPTYSQPGTVPAIPGAPSASSPSTSLPSINMPSMPTSNYNTGTSLPPNTAYGAGPGVTGPAPTGTLYR